MSFSDTLKSYFAPQPDQTRIRDVVREIPGQLSKQIGQPFLRDTAALGQITPLNPTHTPLTPNTPFLKDLYGTDKPITLRSVGASYGLKESAKYTPLVGFIGAVADILPGENATKNIAEDTVQMILKTKSLSKIQGLLRASGSVAENSIPEVAQNLKDVTTRASFDRIMGTMKERGFITNVQKNVPALADQANSTIKVAGQYIPRSTDDLAMKAANLVKDDIHAAEALATTGTDEKAVATAAELIKHYSNAGATAKTEAESLAMYDKAAEIANTIAPKLTELGRSVQAASIMGRLTPEGQLRFAAKTIQNYNLANPKGKIPELSAEDTKFIVDKMKQIDTMPNGWEKAKAFQDLQNYTLDKIPTPIVKKLATVWKAGLLTGIKTSGLNILSNSSHFASEILKDAPAVIVDKAASLFTGERTKTFTLKGVASGVQEGFVKGGRYFKTGFDERNMSRTVDWKRVNFGKGKVAKLFQGYTDTIFRSLGTQDQPFYYGALSRSLYDQALARGINNGYKGKELKDYANFLVQDPDEKMMHTAVLDAATAVFQNKTKLGDIASAVRRTVPASEFIVPFSQTPSAVAMQIINYSPIGAVATIMRNIGKGKFDQRAFSEGIGRSVVGTAPLAIGYELMKNNMVTLDYPTTEREQKLWEAEGRKPNTVLIDGKWRSPMVLGPAGNLILIGAHFQQNFKNAGSPTAAMAQTVLGGLRSFTEQTFLTGVNSFMQAWNDPGRYGQNYVGSFVASAVPTLVSDVANATDPLVRRSDGIVQKVQARIPGAREQLQPSVDVLGNERKSVGNFVEIMLDPTRPSPVHNTPVIQELRRLWDAGQKVSPTLVGNKNGYTYITPEQNTKLFVTTGQLVEQKLNGLFTMTAYKALDDEQKGKTIDKIVTQAQTDSRALMVIEATDGLSGDQLSKRLGELKKGGLLTRDVFSRYQELR